MSQNSIIVVRGGGDLASGVMNIVNAVEKVMKENAAETEGV